MKLVVIFGPSAVGKMTVGLELARLTGYRFFHNHMVMEPLIRLFGYGDGRLWKLVGEFRRRIFEELATDPEGGVIFTYVWALDQEGDRQEILGYIQSLGLTLDEVLFVELEADQEVRLGRNRSELRLREKASKRNVAESEKFIYESERTYRLNSNGDFPFPDRHCKINNTNLGPEDAALTIVSELERRKFVSGAHREEA